MDTVAQLFEHELEDIYYAERKLVEALDGMAEESADAAVRQAFAEHRAQTEGHVARLDDVFAALGKKPKSTTCQGIEGLIKEKREFAKERPSPEILDLFNLAAGAKTERYEISAYQTLISMADEMGLGDAGRLLGQNLHEEEQALATVKNLSKAAMSKGAAASRPG